MGMSASGANVHETGLAATVDFRHFPFDNVFFVAETFTFFHSASSQRS
jgi:hypothetical protein